MEESEFEEGRNWIVIKIHRTIKNALADLPPPLLLTFSVSVCKMCWPITGRIPAWPVPMACSAASILAAS